MKSILSRLFCLVFAGIIGYRLMCWRIVYNIQPRFTLNSTLKLDLTCSVNTSSRIHPRPDILFSIDGTEPRCFVEYYKAFPWGVDMNTAGEHLLTVIHGIGPSTAKKIVTERTIHGPFSTFDDFSDRTGVNTDVMKRYKGWIYVGE